MKWSEVFLIVLFVSLLYCLPQHSAAVLRWSDSVELNEDVVVESQDTLLIQSGTSVTLGVGVSIIVKGVLKIDGSSNAIVSIVPNSAETGSKSWSSIIFESGANLQDSYIHYATIYKRVSITSQIDAAIVVKSTNPNERLIITNTFFNNVRGVDVYGASIELTDNIFDTYSGVNVLAPGSLKFKNNKVIYSGSVVQPVGASIQLDCTNSDVSGTHSIKENSFDKQQIVLKSLSCSKLIFSGNVANNSNSRVIVASNLRGDNTEFKITDNYITGQVNLVVGSDENVVVTVTGNTFRSEYRLLGSSDPQIKLDVNVATFTRNIIQAATNQQIELVNIQYRNKGLVTIRENIFQYNTVKSALKLNGHADLTYPDFQIQIKDNTFLDNGLNKYFAIDVCRVYGLIDISGNDFRTNDPDAVIKKVKDFRSDESMCVGIARIFPAKNDADIVDYQDIDWRTSGTISGEVEVSKYAVWKDITIEPGTVLKTTKSVYLLGHIKIRGTNENPIKWNQQSYIVTKNAAGSQVSDNQYESGSIISNVIFTSTDSSRYLQIDAPDIYIENITLSVPLKVGGSVTLKNSILSKDIAGVVTNQQMSGRYTSVVNLIGNSFNNLDTIMSMLDVLKVNVIGNQFKKSTISISLITNTKNTEINIKENVFKGASDYALSLMFSTEVPYNITLYQNIFNNPSARGELFLEGSASKKEMPTVNAKFNFWGKTTQLRINQRIYDGISVETLPFFVTENVYDISGKNVYPPLPSNSSVVVPLSSKKKRRETTIGIKAALFSTISVIVVAIIITITIAAVISFCKISKAKARSSRVNPMIEPLNDYVELEFNNGLN
jgi:hypothetical protein